MVLDLATALRKDGFSASICSIHEGILGQEFIKSGGRYYPLIQHQIDGNLFSRIIALLKRVLAVRKIMIDECIDIMHAQHLSALLLASLARTFTKVKIIYTEHSRPDIVYGRNLIISGGYFARRADHCTGVSAEITDSLKSLLRVERQRSTSILNGVDIERYSKETKKDLKAEMGFAPTDQIVGCIGNLRHEKNQQQLIEAFSIIVTIHPTARLLLVGGGEYRERLEKVVIDRGLGRNVFLLGPRLDIPELYAAFEVYCLTSVFEGLPLTILEAMAAGCPIVATDVTGIRDVVRAGETGLLVPLHNPELTAQSILRILDDRTLAHYMVEQGRRFVAEHYSLETMAANYRNLYERIMTCD